MAFGIDVPIAGDRVRVQFSNRLGAEPAQIGALTLVADGNIHPVTIEGRSSFDIPVGGVCHSDPCLVHVERGTHLELRLY